MSGLGRVGVRRLADGPLAWPGGPPWQAWCPCCPEPTTLFRTHAEAVA